MGKLTQKQENFVLNLFKGMSQREAWINAGYSSNYDVAIIDTNASMMASSNKIKIRLAELRGEVSSEAIADVMERQEILTDIARAKLLDFVNSEGEITLEAEHSGALQEVTVTDWHGGKAESRNTKVKLHNPITAIAELNKMDGVYSETPTLVNDNRVVNIYVPSEEGKENIERVIEGEGT